MRLRIMREEDSISARREGDDEREVCTLAHFLFICKRSSGEKERK